MKLLPNEDWYIRNLYRFYFVTGLLHLIISILILLDLSGIEKVDYTTLYEMAMMSFVSSVLYFSIPILFFLPFIIKLIRYGRKNFWLGFPLWVWIFQFSLLIFSHNRFLAALAFLFFFFYGILGFLAGIHGIGQIRKYENLELNKE